MKTFGMPHLIFVQKTNEYNKLARKVIKKLADPLNTLQPGKLSSAFTLKISVAM